eukprot:CAMPEP_0172422994 /NCGR_PEP_ID=MMETSP1064-20121228/9080_1 /TAXON_ID=202472 /ORGANISM="Aulacoseira subarctica , Strain CCAP 1002/5" /LENGTH=110 /DNA_ID=CAMNT_0013164105 /DNA_START=115 /DNA_END=444 /DNA_ORIENTATION=-
MVRVAGSVFSFLLGAATLLGLAVAYSAECTSVTQPPIFVKWYLYFKNGFVWTSDDDFTKQSIDSYGRCCNGIATLPGNCSCPLAAANSTDHAKFEKFTLAMYGDNTTSGW